MTEREEMIEKLAQEFKAISTNGYFLTEIIGTEVLGTKVWNDLANRILKNVETPTLRLAIIRKEAKWPENPYRKPSQFSVELNNAIASAYSEAQKNMLAAGAVQEIKEVVE